MHYFNWNYSTFSWDITEIYSRISSWQKVSIGSGNGLVPSRRRAAIRTNEDCSLTQVHGDCTMPIPANLKYCMRIQLNKRVFTVRHYSILLRYDLVMKLTKPIAEFNMAQINTRENVIIMYRNNLLMINLVGKYSCMKLWRKHIIYACGP